MPTSPTAGFGHNSGGNLAGYAPLVGEFALAKTAIYTVPSAKNTAIASIEVFNGTGVEVIATWYINVNGVDNAFGGTRLATMTGFSDSLPRNLPGGTIISGICDTAAVTYVIQLKEYDP